MKQTVPHADPALLPRLAAGRPMVVVAEGVMDPSPLASPALEVWMVALREGTAVLHPFGTRAPDPRAAVPLETPPAGAIALVAGERLRIAALSRWWEEASGLAAPPFLPAATGHAALPALLALLAEALAAARAREAEGASALVAARGEMEAGREAAGGAALLLAHRPPTPPRLVLSGEPGDGPPVEGPARHPLGTGLAGLAAVAVHVAGQGTGEGLLRLRLIGAESERVAGAWAVPAAALAPGWLTLDLPTPLGPLRETAVLEIRPEGEGLPGLSRDARWSGTAGENPLAALAWTGTPGSRYLAPAHWLPEEAGLSLPPAGVPLGLPHSAWGSARALEGQADPVALGDEPPRPLLRAPAGGRTILLLPHLHAPGLDRLRVTLAHGSGEGAAVAAWLRPVDEAGDASGLERAAPGAAWTGWRDVTEAGAELSLPLSARLEGRAALAIGLRAGAGEAAVEIAAVTLSADRAAAAPPIAAAPMVAPAAPPASASSPPEPPAEAALPGYAPGEPVPAEPAVAEPASAGPAPARPASPKPAPGRPAPPEQDRPAPAGRNPARTPPAPRARTASRPAAPVPGTRTPGGPAPAAPMPSVSAPDAPTPSVPAPPVAAPPKAAPPAPPAPSPYRVYTPPSPPPAAAPIPRPMTAAPTPLRATPTNVQPSRAPVRYETVRLHQHLPGDSYRHLDLTIASLAAGPVRWAAVRVKVASKDGEPRLEFRQAAGWPQVFREWHGRASDKFGPFLRITLPELREHLAAVTDERDAALMRSLLAVLPRAVGDACRQANLSVADTEEWVEGARQLLAESETPG